MQDIDAYSYDYDGILVPILWVLCWLLTIPYAVGCSVLFELKCSIPCVGIARQGGTYVFIREEIGEYILTVIIKYILVLISYYIYK